MTNFTLLCTYIKLSQVKNKVLAPKSMVTNSVFYYAISPISFLNIFNFQMLRY